MFSKPVTRSRKEIKQSLLKRAMQEGRGPDIIQEINQRVARARKEDVGLANPWLKVSADLTDALSREDRAEYLQSRAEKVSGAMSLFSGFPPKGYN